MYSEMRDSSKDYRTYWLRDGVYYSKMRNLGDAPCVLPPDKLKQIPADDRQIVTEETDADPAFCRVIATIMATDPDWVHTISNSAKAAAASELDPRKRGIMKSWPKLRGRVRALAEDVAQQAIDAASKLSPAERLAVVKQIAAGGLLPRKAVQGLGNLGQWDIIGSLVGSLAGAGAGIYGATVTAQAQQDIAKIQANAAMQSAQAQMAIANANAAIASAQSFISPVTGALSTLTSAQVGGIPVILPVLALVGAGLYLAFGRKR